MRILNTWASRLFELNDHDSALAVSEYAISLKADVSNIYYLASDIYIEKGSPEKISSLIETAEGLNSVMKDHIVENLRSKI